MKFFNQNKTKKLTNCGKFLKNRIIKRNCPLNKIDLTFYYKYHSVVGMTFSTATGGTFVNHSNFHLFSA